MASVRNMENMLQRTYGHLGTIASSFVSAGVDSSPAMQQMASEVMNWKVANFPASPTPQGQMPSQ
eukprot:3998883-Prorocentrum_lima.AAC.1